MKEQEVKVRRRKKNKYREEQGQIIKKSDLARREEGETKT